MKAFLQAHQWMCPGCWAMGHHLNPVPRGKQCPSCFHIMPEWCFTRAETAGIALRSVRDGWYEFTEGCSLCDSELPPGPLTLCGICGRESCWGREVNVLTLAASPWDGQKMETVENIVLR